MVTANDDKTSRDAPTPLESPVDARPWPAGPARAEIPGATVASAMKTTTEPTPPFAGLAATKSTWTLPAIGAAGGVAVLAALWAMGSAGTRHDTLERVIATAPATPAAAVPAPPAVVVPPPVAPPPVVVAPPPAPDSDEAAQPMDRYEVAVRVEKGDTLDKILRDLAFAPRDIDRAIRELRPLFARQTANPPAQPAKPPQKPPEGRSGDGKPTGTPPSKPDSAGSEPTRADPRAPGAGIRLPAGETVTIAIGNDGKPESQPLLLGLVIRPEITREIVLNRLDDGSYQAQERIFKVTVKTMRAAGAVKGTLRASAEAAGVPLPAFADAMRAFAYDIDFQRDVKSGDQFAILLEQAFTDDGRLVNNGRILAAELRLSGNRAFSVYRFKPEGGAEQFWLRDGQSVVKSLIRTPMDLSRVSSRFGWREHPTLGFTAMHAGTDFAAPPGTPVLAAGGGTIKQAGPNGGYGNYVLIGHDSRVDTAYAHLARFAPGIRPGTRVRQGQVIGFVGSTGLSTGPHLHYELHVGGKPVNPIAHRATVRGGLAGKDLDKFRALVARYDRDRAQAPQIARTAPE